MNLRNTPFASPSATLFVSDRLGSFAPEPVRHARLFRNGANQAVRIPKEFELPPGEVTVRKVGNTLVLEPVAQKPAKGSLAALVAALESMKGWPVVTEPFPDVDEGLAPLDDVEL